MTSFLRLFNLIIVISLSFALLACEPVPENLTEGDGQFVFFSDSFERPDLNSDEVINELFGYRAFIWDWGDSVVGDSYRNVAAVIMGDDVMGPASNGQKALYFYGREGHSIHNIYLVTQSYDLSGVDKVEIEFDYLTFGLNDNQDILDGVDEYLRLDVCTSSIEECGVYEDSFDFNKFESNKWQTFFTHDDSAQKLHHNGRNHLQNEWNTALIRLDITNFAQKDTFTFRWTARMRDGFQNNNLNNVLEDGIAVDNLRGKAIDYFDVDDPNPPIDPDTPGGGVVLD